MLEFRNGALLVMLLALLIPGDAALAQADIPGPKVPCLNCPAREFPPRPETGLWNNPLDPTGTGFTIEVQGDRVVAFLFIYDENGDPEWFLAAGDLQPPAGDDPADVVWVVEAELKRFSGGPCINCPSLPFMRDGSGGQLRFEFLGRNFARFRIDDGVYENLVPSTFGVFSQAVFPELTDYRLPDLEGRWVLVLRGEELSSGSFDRATTRLVRLTRMEAETSGASPVQYEIARAFGFGPLGTPPPVDRIGELECSGSQAEGPVCTFRFDDVSSFTDFAPLTYIAALANIGSSRIVAGADGGYVLQAFRFEHD